MGLKVIDVDGTILRRSRRTNAAITAMMQATFGSLGGAKIGLPDMHAFRRTLNIHFPSDRYNTEVMQGTILSRWGYNSLGEIGERDFDNMLAFMEQWHDPA